MKPVKCYAALVQSQLWVGLMGTCYALFFILQQRAFNVLETTLIFLTFLGGYRYTRVQDNYKLTTQRKYDVHLLILTIVILILLQNSELTLKWIFICFLGLIYNSNFLKIKIRNIPYFKSFYIGMIWALMATWLTLPRFNCIVFLLALLYITSLVIAFDIRDIKYDLIKTLPNTYGIVFAKMIAICCLCTSGILAVFTLSETWNFAFIVSCFMSMILILNAQDDSSEIYYSFILELSSALPLILQLLFNY